MKVNDNRALGVDEVRQLAACLVEAVSLARAYERFQEYKLRGGKELYSDYESIRRVISTIDTSRADIRQSTRYDFAAMGRALAYYLEKTGAVTFDAGYLLPALESSEVDVVIDAVADEVDLEPLVRLGETGPFASRDYLQRLLADQQPTLWEQIALAGRGHRPANKPSPTGWIQPSEDGERVFEEAVEALIALLSQRFGEHVAMSDRRGVEKFVGALMDGRSELGVI